MSATRWSCICLALVLALPTAAAQDSQPVYPVTLIALSRPLADELAEAYSARGLERLWCITAWDTTRQEGATVHTITALREADVPSTATRIPLRGPVCLDANGRTLPTLHSHPGGSCQASPYDVEAMVVRVAPFDGVLCGPRSHAWYFPPRMLDALAWQQQRALARGS